MAYYTPPTLPNAEEVYKNRDIEAVKHHLNEKELVSREYLWTKDTMVFDYQILQRKYDDEGRPMRALKVTSTLRCTISVPSGEIDVVRIMPNTLANVRCVSPMESNPFNPGGGVWFNPFD